MARPAIYPPGSRISWTFRVDKEKLKLVENNLSAFGVTNMTEWIDLALDKAIKAKNLKAKD
jgi:hypothetical protein